MTEFNKTLREEVERINNAYENRRSAWGRGVAVYTEELLDNLDNYHIDEAPCNEKELTERLKKRCGQLERIQLGRLLPHL